MANRPESGTSSSVAAPVATEADAEEEFLAFSRLGPERRSVLLQVSALLDDIDFGTVLLVVQDTKVVQIEMAEKFRLR